MKPIFTLLLLSLLFPLSSFATSTELISGSSSRFSYCGTWGEPGSGPCEKGARRVAGVEAKRKIEAKAQKYCNGVGMLLRGVQVVSCSVEKSLLSTPFSTQAYVSCKGYGNCF